MKLIACYGSLKKGHYNNAALGADADFKGESKIRGVMYSNGSYPKLYHPAGAFCHEFCLGKNFDDAREHVLEVYNIDDKHFARIDAMELGAGYVAEQIDTEWGPAFIWYMPHEHFSSSDKWVESY